MFFSFLNTYSRLTSNDLTFKNCDIDTIKFWHLNGTIGLFMSTAGVYNGKIDLHDDKLVLKVKYYLKGIDSM